MKKISLLIAFVFSLALVAGCAGELPASTSVPVSPAVPTSETQAPTTPGSKAAESDEGEETTDVAGHAGHIMISVAELMEIYTDNNVILIGAISPTAALVPFSNAANPIRGSYLVWTEDIYGPSDDLLSPDLGFGRVPLAEMEELLSRAGVTADSLIVAYHSDAAAVGARIAWHLYMLGLDVRFLDGGVAAWRAANGRTGSSNRLNNQSIQNDFRAPNYDPSVNNVTLEEVIAAVQNPADWVVIDARTEAEHNGERTGASSGAFGTGRIAGSVHVEWARLHDSDGIRLPEAELREMLGFIGDRNVIVFCQGGVRSSYAWIVLKDLGFNVLSYDGAWIEWSYAASIASDYQSDVVLSLTEFWSDNGRVIS